MFLHPCPSISKQNYQVLIPAKAGGRSNGFTGLVSLTAQESEDSATCMAVDSTFTFLPVLV